MHQKQMRLMTRNFYMDLESLSYEFLYIKKRTEETPVLKNFKLND